MVCRSNITQYLLRLTLRQTRFCDLHWGNLTGYRIILRHVGHDVVTDIVCSQYFFGTFSFHFQCIFSLCYAINSQLLHYIVPTREFILHAHILFTRARSKTKKQHFRTTHFFQKKMDCLSTYGCTRNRATRAIIPCRYLQLFFVVNGLLSCFLFPVTDE